MEFRTKVDIARPSFAIGPLERLFFVGSCFADNMAKRFQQEKFPCVVNPYGVMYNPASILHTVERYLEECGNDLPATAFLTLGTNHVYRLKDTGQIVDNCGKRPQKLFRQEELSQEECYTFLHEAVHKLRKLNPQIRVIVTVSPVRYPKYGFHGSQLSKAVLLLAADKLVNATHNSAYFPAYEIVQDELRDYRFYNSDMLHPSQQAVEYIWEQFSDAYLSAEAKDFIREWRPIKTALAHRPFNPTSVEYKTFMEKTRQKAAQLAQRYPSLKL